MLLFHFPTETSRRNQHLMQDRADLRLPIAAVHESGTWYFAEAGTSAPTGYWGRADRSEQPSTDAVGPNRTSGVGQLENASRGISLAETMPFSASQLEIGRNRSAGRVVPSPSRPVILAELGQLPLDLRPRAKISNGPPSTVFDMVLDG